MHTIRDPPAVSGDLQINIECGSPAALSAAPDPGGGCSPGWPGAP